MFLKVSNPLKAEVISMTRSLNQWRKLNAQRTEQRVNEQHLAVFSSSSKGRPKRMRAMVSEFRDKQLKKAYYGSMR